MVISRCPQLSAANTFTFTSPAHSFSPDSTARSPKTTRQQMTGCLETHAQRGTAFHWHRERISYTRVPCVPSILLGFTPTGQQKSQAQLSLKQTVQAACSIQHSCWVTGVENALRSRGARYHVTFSSEALLGPSGITAVSHTDVQTPWDLLSTTKMKKFIQQFLTDMPVGQRSTAAVPGSQRAEHTFTQRSHPTPLVLPLVRPTSSTDIDSIRTFCLLAF